MPRFAPNLPANVPRFYNTVVDEAELISAMQIEGIDEEIAILRVQLKTMMHEKRDAPQEEKGALLIKGMELLARAVAARYRMSPKSKEQLAESMADVLERFMEQVYPEHMVDV